jgi:hypothetical protein
MRAARIALSILGAAAVTTLTGVAHADPGHLTIDWGRLLVEMDSFARHGAEELVPTTHPNAPEIQTQPLVHTAGNAWFGVAPSVTLVARDWGEAYRLAGDRLSLSDEMRLSSSTRMVVSRVRLSDSHVSRITPFAQLGAGQWRTDTNIMPFTPRSTEIAAQIGGGFEVRLAGRWQLACETSATLFIRDSREPQDLAATKLWSTMVASRLVW